MTLQPGASSRMSRSCFTREDRNDSRRSRRRRHGRGPWSWDNRRDTRSRNGGADSDDGPLRLKLLVRVAGLGDEPSGVLLPARSALPEDLDRRSLACQITTRTRRLTTTLCCCHHVQHRVAGLPGKVYLPARTTVLRRPPHRFRHTTCVRQRGGLSCCRRDLLDRRQGSGCRRAQALSRCSRHAPG